MKISVKKIFFAIVAITCFFKANAQSDYVITVKGDSIPCKINTSFGVAVLGGSITVKYKYRSDTMRKAKKINSDEIKGFYIADENNLYKAVFIGDEKRPVFLAVVETGKISLYEMIVNNTYNTYNAFTPGVNTVARTSNGISMSPTPGTGIPTTTTNNTRTLYIGKGSDSVQDIKNTGLNIGFAKSRTERKLEFANLLIDNKTVYSKFIADNEFSFKAIRNIVHLYNTGQPYVEKIIPEPRQDSSNDFNPGSN